MASLTQWKTDSTAVPPVPPPPNPALNAAQTLSPLQIPPWGKPTTPVPFKPQPGIAGSLVKPYIYPLPPEALETGPGPSMPIPPGPPSQPTPPPSGELPPPGPQTPPMGPFGPPAGP